MASDLPQATIGPPARRRRDEGIAFAERHVQQSIFSLKQAKELLAFAQGGGKLAGWSLLGTSAGLALALAFHLPQALLVGTIGSMVGLAVYALRWLQRFKSPKYDLLNDELRDLRALRAAELLTDVEYIHAREKTLKRAGLT